MREWHYSPQEIHLLYSSTAFVLTGHGLQATPFRALRRTLAPLRGRWVSLCSPGHHATHATDPPGVAVEKRSGNAVCSNGVTVTDAACCAWFPVLTDIQENLFNGGQCNAEAHEALRLVFHDSIAISPALEAQGKFGCASPLPPAPTSH